MSESKLESSAVTHQKAADRKPTFLRHSLHSPSDPALSESKQLSVEVQHFPALSVPGVTFGNFNDSARDVSEDTPPAAYLNHGSFGRCPLEIAAIRAMFDHEMELAPSLFYRSRVEKGMTAARHALAEFLNCDAKNLRFVSNACAGLFSVIRSLRLERGDIALCFNTTYHSVRDSLSFACQRAGATLRSIDLKFPLEGGSKAVVAALEGELDALEAGGRLGAVRLVCLDVISSKPAVLFPVRELVAACRRRGLLTLVDAAHAPGHVDLDLRELGADFCAGNCHKWLLTPKTVGFFYVSDEGLFAPGERKHDAKDGGSSPAASSKSKWACVDSSFWCLDPSRAPQHVTDMLCKGIYDESTKDYAAFLALPAGIAAVQTLRSKHDLRARGLRFARWAGEYLCARWGTAPLVPPEMLTFMVNVALPPSLERHGWTKDAVTNALWERYRIEASIFTNKAVFGSAGALHVRVSVHVYNSSDEIVRLADAVLELYGCKPCDPWPGAHVKAIAGPKQRLGDAGRAELAHGGRPAGAVLHRSKL